MINNLERASKYRNIRWTEEQEQILDLTFETLDYLLLTFQRINDIEKINALKDAHQNLHDIVLSMSLNKMLTTN